MTIVKKRLLLGTRNPEKVRTLRRALAPLPIEMLEPVDLDLDLVVAEDGSSMEKNAAKKARAYSAASGLPAMAIDGGLRVVGFTEERQPGASVRRIPGRDEATEEEVLDYYQRALEALGGEAPGHWRAAMSLAFPDGRVVTRRFSFETIMRAERKGRPTPGAPLNCLMMDPASGRYYSEMAPEERPAFGGYTAFVAQYLDEL